MIRSFLAHSTATPGHLGNVLREEPQAAMPSAANGRFAMTLGRRNLVGGAREGHPLRGCAEDESAGLRASGKTAAPAGRTGSPQPARPRSMAPGGFQRSDAMAVLRTISTRYLES